MDDYSRHDVVDVVSLVVVSALSTPPEAVEAWNRLTDAIPFERLPNVAIRAMPQIYLNVTHEADVSDRARLKGVYRSSWSNNAMRFAASRQFFDEMNAQEVNYRIIKGGAISALVGHWGLRRMGDIDIVVAPSDQPLARDILRRLSYFPPKDDGSTRTRTNLFEGNWENLGGAVLDMHSISGKPQLFAELFTEEGNSVALTGTVVRIPSPELMFALGTWHARKAGAATDYIQTLLDLGTLLNHTQLSRAKPVLIRSNLLKSAEEYIDTLGTFGLVSSQETATLSSRSPGERAREIVAKLGAVAHFGGRLSRLPRVIRNRRITRHQQTLLAAKRGMRARLYQLWINCGQIGPIEAAIHKYLGGFGDSGQQGGVGSIPERDFRFRIDGVRGVPSVLLIHFSVVSRGHDPASRNLFINGKGHGTVPLPEGVAGRYEVTPVHDFVEISARALDPSVESTVTSWKIRWID